MLSKGLFKSVFFYVFRSVLEYHKYACDGLNSSHRSTSVSLSQHNTEDLTFVGSNLATTLGHGADNDFVECPLCNLSFPMNVIERHAATCGET